MSKRILFVVLAVALMATACQPIQRPPSAAPAAPAGSNPLAGTRWLLTELSGQPALADVSVTASFAADGSLSGSGGCNSYSTTYSVDGSSLTVSPQIAATMMACPDPVMNQETAYFQALTSVATFAIDGETLTLSGADGAALAVFRAQSQSLGGTNWTITGFNNGKQAVVSPMLGSEITLSFAADGTVSGNSGCNNYSGTYTAADGAITIGPLASTMKMCVDEAVMTQEAQYLAALASSVTYSINGTLLTTRSAQDEMAINAIPAQ